MRNIKFETTIIDFITKERGCFITISDDATFLAIMRTVVHKHLAIADAQTLIPVMESSHILKQVNEAIEARKSPFIIMERRLDGQDMAIMVKQIKAAFPKILILILTVEVEKHRIMYLHELGADNFIAKPVSAQTVIEKLALTLKPQSQLGQLIDKAKSLLEHGHVDLAKTAAYQILEMKPGSSAGFIVLGDAEMALGDMEAAKNAYLEAANNADLYLEPLRKLAALAEKTGDFEGCLAYLERLDELSPLNSDRKLSMGEINLNLGREEKAEALFDAAIVQATKEAMDQIGHMAERVASLYTAKDPSLSEKFLRKALEAKKNSLSKDDIRVFNQLGISLRKQGKWQDAITEYKRALRLSPKEEALHYNIGMAYAEGGLLDDACKAMGEALRLNPKLPYSSASLAYNIGYVFMRGSFSDRARQCFEIALQLKPDMRQAQQALAKL